MLVAAVGFSFAPELFAQAVERPAIARATNASEDQPSSRAITGSVLDPSGAAIAKAQVSLLTSDDKPVSQTATDNSGSFRFDHIAPGNFIIDFQAEGFREARVNVNLTAKRPAPLRVTMRIAVLKRERYRRHRRFRTAGQH